MPPEGSIACLGAGGPSRQLGHPSADLNANERVTTSRGIILAQEEVRSSLRKAKKMQVRRKMPSLRVLELTASKEANTPSYLILPRVLSAVQMSNELGLWPLYRHGIIVLGEVLVSMEGAGMAPKAMQEVLSVWDQVRHNVILFSKICEGLIIAGSWIRR